MEWIIELLSLVWNRLFSITIPIYSGISFGTLGIISFIGCFLASIFSKFFR